MKGGYTTKLHIPDEMRSILKNRQIAKFQAIRTNPIFDQEIRIPVRNTEIRCLEYIPKQNGILPVVFDIHGGGFTNGFPEEDDWFCRQVCDRLQIRVFSIDYRLAPDFPFPEGQLDVYEVIRYIVDHSESFGICPDRMVICGHSAGGNLAMATVMRAIESKDFSFRGLILDYPPLDLATPARDKFYVEGCVPVDLADLFNQCYCGPEEAAQPLCSPRFVSDETLRYFPPATIVTCEIDSLRDEAEEIASRLLSNGVEVTAKRFLGQKHAFSIQYDNPASLEAIEMMINGIQRYLHL